MVFPWPSQANEESIAFVKMGGKVGQYNKEWKIF